MSIKQAIKTINEEIVRLEQERSDLQEACKHPTYQIVEYQWRIASTYITRYCTECNSSLGTPSQDELEEFENGDAFKVYVNNAKEGCKCHHCYQPPSILSVNELLYIVCPDCGNKRCPKANHHDNACTNSNATGQKGSAYK